MSARETKYKRAPRWLAWGAAVFSALLVVLLAGLIIFVSGELRVLSLHRSWSAALEVPHCSDSGQYLDELLELITPVPLTRAAQQKLTLLTRQDWALTTRELHEILCRLADRDLEGALLKFNALLDGKLRNLLFVMAPTRDNAASLSRLRRDFRSYQEQLRRLQQASSLSPNLLAEQRALIRSQWKLAADLTTEYGRFFNLTPQEARSNGRLSFYARGVLAGLPILQGLPDALSDLVELRAALEKAGGTVRLQGAEAPVLFKERLEYFSAEFNSYAQEVSAREEQIEKLQTDLMQLNSSVEELRALLLRQLHELLLAIIQPEPSQATRIFLGLTG